MNAHPTAGTAASNLQAGARLALVGLAVNVAFAFIKIAAGVFGNAYALIADGIESALDAAGSIVIWGGLRFAARPPDATHPYGHGKAEPLAAVVVALGVLVAAAALAVASVREIFLPHHGPAPFTLFVLIIAVIVKGSLFRSVSRLGRAIDSTAITTDAWHHRADAIISMAAAVGISIALVGGEKWQRADDYAALFACAVIATTGARLLGPALGLPGREVHGRRFGDVLGSRRQLEFHGELGVPHRREQRVRQTAADVSAERAVRHRSVHV